MTFVLLAIGQFKKLNDVTIEKGNGKNEKSFLCVNFQHFKNKSPLVRLILSIQLYCQMLFDHKNIGKISKFYNYSPKSLEVNIPFTVAISLISRKLNLKSREIEHVRNTNELAHACLAPTVLQLDR